jgi:hypothetical protein
MAIMLFISGTILAVFSFDNGEFRSKFILTIMFLIIFGIVIFLFSILSIFSQHTDEIFSKTSSRNYKAIYSRDFDLVLAGPKRLTIKKTKLNGLIEKTIYNELVTNPDTNPSCTLNISHGNKKLSFDYCKNILKVEE